VVLPEQASGLAATIAAAGFEPVPVDLSELLKTGGGPKCCTLEPRY
jgi:N-dimethylarginine dimethylaminohydrolase